MTIWEANLMTGEHKRTFWFLGVFSIMGVGAIFLMPKPHDSKSVETVTETPWTPATCTADCPWFSIEILSSGELDGHIITKLRFDQAIYTVSCIHWPFTDDCA